MSGTPPPPVVGFDLDMTLIDTRPGIAATYRALTELTGVPVDAELAVSRLGPPLELEIAQWFPADQVVAATARYRELYPVHAIAPCLPLPGAVEALAAVRAAGGRAIVVTAKRTDFAVLHLRHLGLTVSDVAGSVWREGKAAALRAAGATAYVGDHVADMAAALAAGVPGVGVTTGPCNASELFEAGASVVFDALTRFPAWLNQIPVGGNASGN